VQLDLNQLRELLADFDKTDISELTLKSGDFELTVRKDTHLRERLMPPAPPPPGAAPGWPAAPPPPPPPPVPAAPEGLEARGTAATGVSAPSASAGAPPPLDKKWVDVISPMVGTFYRAPAPDEPPFVGVGDRIKTGQTVCIIEAMKLMNEIEAEVSGQVMEILAQNAEPVEYGQVLMRINPD
jgi:acetyl-CoA carboxylase biotin carboxyl carrier protein